MVLNKKVVYLQRILERSFIKKQMKDVDVY